MLDTKISFYYSNETSHYIWLSIDLIKRYTLIFPVSLNIYSYQIVYIVFISLEYWVLSNGYIFTRLTFKKHPVFTPKSVILKSVLYTLTY